jgi:hypothetical protein
LTYDDIATEIKQRHGQIIQAFNQHDAEKIAAFIDQQDDLHYVEHTQITIGWQTLKQGFEQWHLGHSELTIEIKYAHVNVLTEDIAVLVSAGDIYRAGHRIQAMTWTAVFQRKECEWKIVNAHETVSAVGE